MNIKLTPASAMLRHAKDVTATVADILPEAVLFCETEMRQAASKFGRTKVIIEYKQIRDTFPYTRNFDPEPFVTGIRSAFEAAGYVVDTSHDTFLSISCEGATHV